jgi:hypothetical protein
MFEEKAKSLKEGERPQKISKDPSCAFNATDCVNGVCVLTKVSPEEERARAEKRMKEMQPPAGNQGGPQGGAQAGPPPSNGHSYKPQGVPNGNGPSNGKAAPAMNPRGPQAN